MSTKYCALCLKEAKETWTVSRSGEVAFVPLCEDHEPQIERLWRLCLGRDEESPGGKIRPGVRRHSRPKSFEPLDWTPPTDE